MRKRLSHTPRTADTPPIFALPVTIASSRPVPFLKSFPTLIRVLIGQRIAYRHDRIPLFKGSLICDHFDSSPCMNAEIIAAVRTDVVVLFYLIYKNSALAGIAFFQHSIRTSGFVSCLALADEFVIVRLKAYLSFIYLHSSDLVTSRKPISKMPF